MEDRQVEREIAELLRRLESGPDAVAPALQRNLERKLANDLRPVEPLRPAGFFVALWGMVFVVVVVAGVLRLGPLAVPLMGPALSALVIGVLAASAVALMISLALQMSPGSRFRVAPGVLPVVVAAAVTALFAGWLPLHPQAHFWRGVWRCFSVGITFGAISGILTSLALRRGTFESPTTAGATAGLLAGLAGTTLLAIHCPILEMGHVVLAHVGAAIAAGLAGMVIAVWRLRRP